ncbi:enoyl-CoA hydratase/isomerase family protein [Photobacterium leiognathi subsp. mandapamensis]
MNTQPTVLVSVSTTGVATLTLNRAERSNAFDPNMITALLTALEQLKTQNNIRCLILDANGKHFHQCSYLIG